MSAQQQQQQKKIMCDSSTQYEENPVAQDPHVCGICLCETWGEDKSETICSHVFHTDCMKSHILHEIKKGENVKCPLCRQVYMTKKLFYENIKKISRETEEREAREAREATEATAALWDAADGLENVAAYDAEGHSEWTSDEEDQRTFAEIYDADEQDAFRELTVRRSNPLWAHYSQNSFLPIEEAPNREHILGDDYFMTIMREREIYEALNGTVENCVNVTSRLLLEHTASNLEIDSRNIEDEYTGTDPWGRISQERYGIYQDRLKRQFNNEKLKRLSKFTDIKKQRKGWQNDGDHILKRSVRCFNCNYLTQRPHRFAHMISGKKWYCKTENCMEEHDRLYMNSTQSPTNPKYYELATE